MSQPDSTTSSPRATEARAADAAEVLRQSRLVNVRLKRSSAQAFRHLDNLPDEIEIAPTIGFTKPIAVREGPRLSVHVTFVFGMSAKWPSGNVDQIVAIRCTSELVYVLSKKAPEFAQTALDAFALKYGPFHAWGYWREFVQSMLARLDLPTFILPMLWLENQQRFLFDDAQADLVVQDQPPPTGPQLPFHEGQDGGDKS